MKRKMSTIERMIDGNVVFAVTLAGDLDPARLRAAIDRVQAKHPALRMLVREQGGALLYEMDCAPPVPLRIVEGLDHETHAREWRHEAYAPFVHELPQLRLTWLRSDDEHELLIAATHRICDGMSQLTIVRELLDGLHSTQALAPYRAITPADVIGDFDDGKRWKRRAAAWLVNAVFALLPPTRRPVDKHELHIHWSLGADFTEALRRRCKAESVSLHTALLLALSQAQQRTLQAKMPDWIESPIDARRERLSMLKSDMLFFGGGSFKVPARQHVGADFWGAARELNRHILQQVAQGIEDIPGKYQFCEMIRPPSQAKIRSLVRLGDAISRNRNWNLFSFSNLGNIQLLQPDSPLRVRRLRIYVHSFASRVLGVIAYTLNGELNFMYTGDDQCLSRAEADALRAAFMAQLEACLAQPGTLAPAPGALDAEAA